MVIEVAHCGGAICDECLEVIRITEKESEMSPRNMSIIITRELW